MEDMTSIKGQVAVVTGGTAGMGEATCVRFGAEGAKVAVIGRTPEKGAAVVKRITDAGGEAMFVRAECADEYQQRTQRHAQDERGVRVRDVIEQLMLGTHAREVQDEWLRKQSEPNA